MKSLIVGVALFALTACNSSEPEPVPTPPPVAVQPIEPTMPPPDKKDFAEAYAEACPSSKPVSTALCRSKGLGKKGFVCEYGLGSDEYRRNSASVVPADGKWMIAESEEICAAKAA